MKKTSLFGGCTKKKTQKVSERKLMYGLIDIVCPIKRVFVLELLIF
jgi:hypothetical protein